MCRKTGEKLTMPCTLSPWPPIIGSWKADFVNHLPGLASGHILQPLVEILWIKFYPECGKFKTLGPLGT